ncbi:MAG: uracil-DNA glycosylase [Planctomycetaceae bacterium]|nr:uracil-DNA glycosylase [Planctomycetaceae bacterium]
MSDSEEMLKKAAAQLLAIENFLGGAFLPAKANPLPAPAARQVAQTPRPQAAPTGPAMSRDEKSAALEALSQQIAACRKCSLAADRANPVPGEGNPDAQLVFVGEAPGADEDRTGHPFVGRAGDLLTKMIAAMGLTRQDVYICNMVKCRPPENRTPTPQEIQACWGHLAAQLQIIRPRVIVTLGNPATQNLLQTTVGITRLRGQWQTLGDAIPALAGTPVMPTFHPAYVLRNYSEDTRRKVWSDLQAVMDLLGLPRPVAG